MTSGACGCHNLDGATNIAQFSNGHGDIKYDAMLAKSGLMGNWAEDKIGHPGGGSIYLTAREKHIINTWIEQGGKSDYTGGGSVTGPVTFSATILPLINTSCNGGSCHGGAAVALTYSKITTTTNIAHLTEMANSGGTAGHPGPKLSLSATATATILAWIQQGTPQ